MHIKDVLLMTLVTIAFGGTATAVASASTRSALGCSRLAARSVSYPCAPLRWCC